MEALKIMISGVLTSGKGTQCELIAANFALNRPLHLSPPPFNTTTLIKPMNKEEEEAPLEDSRICRNRLARERHAARSEKQCAADAHRRATHRAARSGAQIAADASRRATQRAVCSNAQIAANASWRSDAQITTDANRRAVKRTVHNDVQNVMHASWRVVQRTACNDAPIAVENVGRVNTWTLLHSNMQQEMHNMDPQAH